MRYELIIHWNKEDQAFLVEVPEQTGASWFSNTPDKGARASRLFSNLKNRSQKEFK